MSREPSIPDGRSRPWWRRRLGIRVVLLPLLILGVAWMLEGRSTRLAEEHLGRAEAAVTAFARQAIGGEPATAIEPPPGLASLRQDAAEAIRRAAAEAGVAAVEQVVILAGDPGPGRVSTGTHTATLRAGDRDLLHLRLAVDDSRVVLAGWWRPASVD